MRTSFVIAALAGLLLAAGCSKTTCGGPIDCESLAAVCGSVPGCKAQPACELKSSGPALKACSSFAGESECLAPRCAWTGTTCVDQCSTITERDACNLRSPDHNSYGEPSWSCRWSACTGTPTRRCSDFSPDMCPTDLGCVVDVSCSWGDC